MLRSFCMIVFVLVALYGAAQGWGEQRRVLLRDVSVITLHEGARTTGRRSSPVPQLKCLGGACSKYRPSVIQCYNKGFDGRDVQWKCEADLDKRVKFGRIEVTCEGFDYPDDPYILEGSCGLEYALEYTGSGGSSGSWFGSKTTQSAQTSRGSWVADLLILAVAVGIIYVIYKTCTTPGAPFGDRGGGRHGGVGGGGGYDGRPGPGGGPGGGGNPPPYGFRDDHDPPPSYDDCHRAGSHSNAGQGAGGIGGGSGPGFWTGLGTGGVLGYLFGGGGRQQHHNYGGYGGYGRRDRSWWDDSGSGSGGGGGSMFGGSGGSSSSTTRTASGYGGTRRR